MRVYAIYDRKAMETSVVFKSNTDAAAYRDFQQAVSKSAYPEDFDLICLTAELDGSHAPQVVGARLVSPMDFESEVKRGS